MKVYVVETGEYEDVEIVAVCSTEEKAEEICEAFADCYYHEEEVDNVVLNNRKFFRVVITEDAEI